MKMTNLPHHKNKLYQAVYDKNVNEVARLIPLSRSKSNRTEALRLAAFMGNHEIVKLLAPVSDCHKAVVGAVSSNDQASFDLLLEMSPNSDQTQALQNAAEFNKIEFVKKLLPYANPNCNEWQCPLLKAAWNGQVESLKLLLSVYDPKRFNSKALQVTAVSPSTHEIGKWMCMEVLYDISDVPAAITGLKREGWKDNIKNLKAFGRYHMHQNTPDPLYEQTYKQVNTSKLYRAVRNCDAAEVKRLIPISDPTDQSYSALITAIVNNDTQCTQLLLPFYPWNEKTEYLDTAAQNGCIDVLHILLPFATAQQINSAFVVALVNNHVSCSDVLKPLVSDAHIWAPPIIEYYLPSHGHLFALQTLIEMAGTKNVSPKCIGNAARYRHMGCVKELMKYFDPKECESFALRSILDNDTNANSEMLRFLYPLSDPTVAMDVMHKNGEIENCKRLEIFQQRILEENLRNHTAEAYNKASEPLRKI